MYDKQFNEDIESLPHYYEGQLVFPRYRRSPRHTTIYHLVNIEGVYTEVPLHNPVTLSSGGTLENE